MAMVRSIEATTLLILGSSVLPTTRTGLAKVALWLGL